MNDDRQSDPATTAVIVSAARTPIGRFLGGLSPLSAPELGAIAIRAAWSAPASSAARIDEVIMGNVVQGGVGQAPARQAAYHGGVPETVPAHDHQQGVRLRAQGGDAGGAGDPRRRRAGHRGGRHGVDVQRAVLPVRGYREGVKFGNQQLVDGLIHDGLWCSFGRATWAATRSTPADKAGITREEADEFSYQSHRKAIAAIDAGKFREEIVPVEIAAARARPRSSTPTSRRGATPRRSRWRSCAGLRRTRRRRSRRWS
jgi:acetyl-CoA C-acetyltransferase